ncbi:hypothetical protein GCM10011344_39520 [Dokdonia pacifica]|uniref:Uncharacterized protein n=1 Tax=Dokdonia pacifica TaxID=1627892 RepID=A0A239A479_9FLAO|nr:hypothetical protein [Dokdonia pacifica]GGG34812.1 hypothetical protein GCM10011344_39520 [Dokdonia pacifica]SNR90299.1 hypothetical protein SAMN06265376_104135 [Dokdonia pacifica]
MEKLKTYEILKPQCIYGGANDHQDNDGIPPDENDRSDWGVIGG